MPAGLAMSGAQKASIKILVVDDDDTVLDSSVSILKHDGYDVEGIPRGVEAEGRLREGTADIVLIDLYMLGVTGSRLLRTALKARPDVLVILITGRPSVESSIQGLREGAWDYLPKPFSATQLLVLVGRAAHTVIVSRESQSASSEVTTPPGGELVLLGESPAFVAAVSLARRVAVTDASVFITGESGTGKELVAQFIHRNSRRKSREMVAVNCAALPEALLESEMFGHVKGAFTGATEDKSGLMEVANGGTLFLDELTEMLPMTQAKLLRVLQDGVLRRVGSSKTDAVVNVRFISATNQDPAQAVDQGRLREDLYYRLGVVPIHIPPLRERPQDIPVIANHFLQAYWLRHHGSGKSVPVLTDAAVRQLQQRPWRGNVRELQNVMEHAIVLAEGRAEIDAADLPEVGGNRVGEDVSAGGQIGLGVPMSGYHETRERVIERFQREYLSWVLQETDGNVSEAARLAGVSRATLYRLLGRSGLLKDDLMD